MKGLYSISGIKITDCDKSLDSITFYAHSTKQSCKCPLCNKSSNQVRSRYTRSLMDLPSGGCRITIVLHVRKFKCSNVNCEQKIFSERYPGYTNPYSRKTNRALEQLSSMLIEVSSSKGSYLSNLIQMNQSASTCLRIVSNLSIPVYTDKDVIGIDDFAFRKGINYGSIIIDAKTGSSIDLINSREESAVTSWLKDHPEIKIATRDRSSCYSKAIRVALPSCEQIADKFHLVKNLSDRINEVIKKQYSSIKESYISSLRKTTNSNKKDVVLTEIISSDKVLAQIHNDEFLPIATRKPNQKEILFNQIHELHNNGISTRKIATTLQVNRETVRHYLRHEIFPQKRAVYTNDYCAYLDSIIGECQRGRSKKEIYETIKGKGFKGKLTAFYSWFNKHYPDYNKNQKEGQKGIIEKKPEILFNSLSSRKISIYITNPSWGIKKNKEPSKEYLLMLKIIESSSLLQNLQKIALSFKDLLKGRNPELLNQWLDNAAIYKLPEINSFVSGIRFDIDAVRNAIVYSWTNGVTEGNVNRLKTKKREMYGRAGFELLRRKVVLSKTG